MAASGGLEELATDEDQMKLVSREAASTGGHLGPVFVRGEGPWLFNSSGIPFFDGTAGSGAVSLGHQNPAVVDAIVEQARALLHTGCKIAGSSRTLLTQRLGEILPFHKAAILPTVTGSEAVETAIKIARAATGQRSVVALPYSFHGKTEGALRASWREDLKRYSPAASDDSFRPVVPPPTRAEPESVDQALGSLELALREAGRSHGVATVIAEPVQITEGVRPLSVDYLNGVATLARSAGALFVVDEIYTGMGRTGSMFYSDRLDHAPDLLLLGKALGNGMPPVARERDPWRAYRTLRESESLWNSPSEGLLLSRYDDIVEALTHPGITVFHPYRSSRMLLGHTILDSHGDEHRELRRLIGPLFSPAAMRRISETIVRPCVRSALDEVEQAGDPDLHRAALQIPIHVMARLFGFDEGDCMRMWSDLLPIIEYLGDGNVTLASATQGKKDLEGLTRDVMSDANISEDSVIGQLVSAPGGLTEEDQAEIVRHVIFLLLAGTETTVCAIANLVYCLKLVPDLEATVRADTSLIPSLVEETLRWQPPLHQLVRFVAEATVVAGTPVKAGQLLTLLLASGNRDEARYEAGDTFDLMRTKRHDLSFGSGAHACVGLALAKLETAVFTEELLGRYSRVLPTGEILPTGLVFRRPREIAVSLDASSRYDG